MELHLAKTYRTRVEGETTRLRHYLARLCRKTLRYSKSVEMLKCSILEEWSCHHSCKMRLPWVSLSCSPLTEEYHQLRPFSTLVAGVADIGTPVGQTAVPRHITKRVENYWSGHDAPYHHSAALDRETVEKRGKTPGSCRE